MRLTARSTTDDFSQRPLFRNWRSRKAVIGLVILLMLVIAADGYAFGPTGHRVVGRIAENHLTTSARSAIKRILGAETLAQASTWPDEIRSDPMWDHSQFWHYVSIEDGETYESSPKDERGDVIEAIKRFVASLKDPEANEEDKVVAIRWLVHLVSDVHQPLHDHYGGYYELDEENRLQELKKHKHRWATSWIVLPNATYGGWLPRNQQDRLDALEAWDGR